MNFNADKGLTVNEVPYDDALVTAIIMAVRPGSSAAVKDVHLFDPRSKLAHRIPVFLYLRSQR